jgi:hypothetical protein
MKNAASVSSRLLVIAMLSGAVGAPVSLAQVGQTPIEAVNSYLDDTRAVIDEINLDVPNAQKIVSTIGQMLDLIPSINAKFTTLHPECKTQLDALNGLLPQVDVWSAVEIRRNVEAGVALPAGGQSCYPARDLVAHPAIVRALTRVQDPQTIRARLLREINEALEHGEEIAAEFTNN